MNPVKLHLTNFTSYKEEDVNLEGIDIAVATGDNGAGKSSLATDAITWALFGEGSKGGKKNLNDYVKRGEQEGRVELQFNLGESLYRVVRHRSVAKDKTMLEFFVQEIDGETSISNWVARSGKSITETQEIIEKTLRMDYRTFISSSLILQGKADSFTNDMTDAERKDALARILGLDIWDLLQAKVKSGAKQLNDKLTLLINRKAPLQSRVDDSEAAMNELKEIKEKLSLCEQELKGWQTEVDSITGKLATRGLLRNQVEDISRKKESVLQERTNVYEEISMCEKKIARLNNILENSERVLAAIEEEKALTGDIASIEKDLAKLPLLEQQLNDLHEKIMKAADEVKKLKLESFNISADLMDLDFILKKKEDILEACEQENELQSELQEHERKSSVYMQLGKTIEALHRSLSVWEGTHKAIISGIESSIEAKRPLVATLSSVPCSGSVRDACALLTSARIAADEMADLTEKLEVEKGKSNPHQSEYDKAVSERDALGYNSESHAACRNLLEEVKKTSSLKAKLDAAEARKIELEKRDAEIKDRLKEIQVPSSDPERVEQLGSEIVSLKDSEEDLSDLKSRLAEAQKKATLKPELDSARALLPELQELLTKNRAKYDALWNAVLDLDKQLAAANDMIADLNNLDTRMDDLKTKIGEAKDSEAGFRTEIGKFEQTIHDAEKARKDLDAIVNEEKDLRSQTYTLDILDQACGKKSGVPALIIENAVPEIERLANDMLNRITGGRMQLRLDTQVEGKSTGTMQDVLRITILDEGLPGAYQTFSGAERFIIDISLRVAISKFLAHRAGAEIKLLVIDEGFGSLDASGRQKILSVIDTVRQDFAKVIIITHLEELKDAFPRRIEVSKGPEGSKVNVA
jgi:exonuclease SbcC